MAASGFLAFLAAYLHRTFSGYYFYDDYSYARFAHQLVEGTFSLQNDTFSHRLGFLLPIAALYAVMGISDFLPFSGRSYVQLELLPCFFTTSVPTRRSVFTLQAGISVMLALFVAFMTKETALYTFAFFAGLIFYEYRKGGKPGKTFALTATLTGLLCCSIRIPSGTPHFRWLPGKADGNNTAAS